ncbi:HicA toxin of toxin-antitoxin [Lachnospiraceae bacterium]|nr:HicA toxin of toxin-antitoxin [Lachnospiraceae bacterium]
MKTSELVKKLKKQGCYLTDHGKEHDEWYSPITQKYFRIPRHKRKEIPNGTAVRIMKDAGIK